MSIQQVAHHRRQTGRSRSTAERARTDPGGPIIHRHPDVVRLVGTSTVGSTSGAVEDTRRRTAVSGEGRP